MKATIVRLIVALMITALMAGCTSTPSAQTGSNGSSDAAPSATTSAEPKDKYPDKPIRFILPNGAGGATENSARKWDTYFAKTIGMPLQFDFIEGSGTMVATNVLKESAPDGYTMMLLSVFDFCHTIANMDAPYKMDDFEILGINMSDVTAIMVRKDAPWNTLQELLDYMKTKPEGTVSMGLTAVSTSDRLGVAELEKAAGVKFNAVAFGSGSKARTALVGGQVDVGHYTLFGSNAILEDVKILALHVDKNPFVEGKYKDIPTVNSVVGQKLTDITSDYGIVVPVGFSQSYPERAKKILDALHSAWSNPELMTKLATNNEEDKIYSNVLSPEDATAYVKKMYDLVAENKELLMGSK